MSEVIEINLSDSLGILRNYCFCHTKRAGSNVDVFVFRRLKRHHHHHHHHDAKRSALASRRCDLSPKRAVFCQLQSVGHWYSRVPTDLLDPGNGRSTTSAFPIRRWPGTVLGFAASPKDLVCWFKTHARIKPKVTVVKHQITNLEILTIFKLLPNKLDIIFTIWTAHLVSQKKHKM